MIKIVCGVYGHYINGKVVPKDKNADPFELTAEQEARLVKQGIAEYVCSTEPVTEYDAPIGFDEAPDLPAGVTGIPAYSVDMKVAELREIGAMCGLSFKVGMSKAEMVAELDKHIEEHTVEGVEVDDDGEITVDEDAPTFDAADAVVE